MAFLSDNFQTWKKYINDERFFNPFFSQGGWGYCGKYDFWIRLESNVQNNESIEDSWDELLQTLGLKFDQYYTLYCWVMGVIFGYDYYLDNFWYRIVGNKIEAFEIED